MKSKTKLNLLVAIFIVMIMPLALASNSLGTYQVNKQIELIQTCDNGVTLCSFCSITAIKYPTSDIAIANADMTKRTSDFYYMLTSDKVSQLGTYTVDGFCSDNEIQNTFHYDFLVTPSGYGNILGFFVIIIAVIYGIAFFGFFGKNVWVAMLGGMAMIALGIYTINNGIDIYRTFITNVFSWVTIGIGAIFSLTAGLELIEDNI